MAGYLFQVFFHISDGICCLLCYWENTLDCIFVSHPLLHRYPHDIPAEAFSFEIFKQAFVAVQSCGVHLQVSLYKAFFSSETPRIILLFYTLCYWYFYLPQLRDTTSTLIEFALAEAISLINCFSWCQKVPLARRFALVPMGPPLLAYRSDCKAMLIAREGAVELVVDRPYKCGEPIVIWYIFILFYFFLN